MRNTLKTLALTGLALAALPHAEAGYKALQIDVARVLTSGGASQ